RYETPYALTAPSRSVPSRPRLMRPLFSVSVSPKLTNRYGVLTRIIPPIIANGTPHRPRLSFMAILSSRLCRCGRADADGRPSRSFRSGVRCDPTLHCNLGACDVGFTREDHQEQKPFEH